MANEQQSGHEPKEKDKDKVYHIIVDGRPREWNEHEISYREVVLLYDPNAVFGGDVDYIVTYTKGHEPKPKGSLVDGEKTKVKDRMEFYVKRTNRS